jgi:hypothetical protein
MRPASDISTSRYVWSTTDGKPGTTRSKRADLEQLIRSSVTARHHPWFYHDGGSHCPEGLSLLNGVPPPILVPTISNWLELVSIVIPRSRQPHGNYNIEPRNSNHGSQQESLPMVSRWALSEFTLLVLDACGWPGGWTMAVAGWLRMAQDDLSDDWKSLSCNDPDLNHPTTLCLRHSPVILVTHSF